MLNKILITSSALFLAAVAQAEEKPSPLLTAISSTTLSGYVNVSAYWNTSVRPLLFDDVSKGLRTRGFEQRTFGRNFAFYQSGRPVAHFYKTGPLATRSQMQVACRLLKGAA